MAGTVKNIRGAIGYVENAYAISNKLVTTQLRNKAGQFVKPTHEAFIAAATNADWTTPGMAASLIDQAGRHLLADRLAHLHPAAEESRRMPSAAAT